ncbi:MAG TPA: SRPBCC domain-containing protein [Pseudomonadales bacterium]|nr:SRPBCC domain-containing protein [Pseudomonadales bacterium]
MKTNEETTGFKLTVTRVINAPCAKVWRAWTEPKQLAQWFCPKEVECRGVTADVKVGGPFRVHIVSDKGDHIAIGKYREIIPNQRVQFTWEWETYAMPNSVVTVSFEDLGATTRLTLVHEGLPDEEDQQQHTHGWNSLVEKFAELIEQNKIK